MNNKKYFLAIDIGASSGRHIIGWTENGDIMTDEVFRFPNGNVTKDGHLTWDIDALFESIVEGISAAFAKYPRIESLAIDTWGVDYVLMKGDEIVYPCHAYRDSRTEAVIPRVHGIIPFAELYSRTGIAFNSFNTIYQLYDDCQKGRLEGVTDFLMMPEFLSYKLTGVKMKEYTNATTAGLVNAKNGKFDRYITRALGFKDVLFPDLSAPGAAVGVLKSDIAERVGGQTTVVLCASHDTASAVEGIGMETDALYISSGTWSLLGVKAPEAITDEGSRLANYSNEGGIGYVRYQKNIMGMWTVQSLRRELCPDKDYQTIEKEAVESGFSETVDINGQDFLAPESMKAAFDRAFEGREAAPKTEADYFSCAYHSLALSYKNAIAELEANLGRHYDFLYIVGGGAKNKYLNELTEKSCGIKVIALPIEATSIGNLRVQMERR